MTGWIEDTASRFFRLPWWANVTFGVFLFLCSDAVGDMIDSPEPIVQGIVGLLMVLGFLVGLFFLILALPRERRSRSARWSMVDEVSNVPSVKAIDWKDFEGLVGKMYRRKGFAVSESVGRGPDGGVDLRLRKDGELSVVQCKQWTNYKVGVRIVRELFGVMNAEGAVKAIVVTTSKFTKEAREFAEGKPIELIDGKVLLKMIQDVQVDPRVEVLWAADAGPGSVPAIGYDEEGVAREAPACPKCGREMVTRVARKGPNEGRHFYGCDQFPRCWGTRPIESGKPKAEVVFGA